MRGASGTSLLFALSLAALPAAAQGFPAKPVRLIIPNPPGGTLDITARVVAPKMTELLGQSVIVDNRPGADGNIGTEFVARSPADGYTVLFNTVPLVVNPSLLRKVPYNVKRDFAPVSLIVSSPFVLVVNPSVPAKSIKDLIALAKAHPDKLTYGSAGNGSNLHVAAELFKYLTGTKMLHVLYKGGGPALVAVMSGEVDLSYLNVAAVLSYARAGKLRALAMTGTQRSPLMPELPTVAESGVPGYEFGSWVGALVPAATPGNTIKALNDGFTRVTQSPDVVKRFGEQGASIVASTPEAFGKFLDAELARWAKVVRETGMKAD
ncbi:MAG: tripartite tricarboxylate transporter substrate binding protein [Burkholderiales bacterium]|nr:tripartite tricarboxylate transporter substrate binding protein [Burkholderiales bacterium]